MYATVHQFRGSLGELLPGPLGTCALTQVGGLNGAVVAFWPDAAAAAGARQPAGTTWLDSGVYEVADVRTTAAEPRFAQLSWFDGPRTADQAAAERRASTERIWPAIRDVEGIGPSYILTAQDRATVIVGFAASIETIEATQRAIMSTELLPGEDPALLPGPDRIDLYRVVRADLPETAVAR
ncbi:hypothetical protein ACGFMK_17770 [Amycolatopsis sp. NPDC049252]|uniref:hypothetical protein n=1 Tax=Amycolatopsis sp. NPDC049252 TaxID=3363933 RepID=UPI00371DDCB0